MAGSSDGSVEIRITGSVDSSLQASTAEAAAKMDTLAASAGMTGTAMKTEAAAVEVSTIAHGRNRAVTESLVVAHEALQGRISRIPGSLMILAQAATGASTGMLVMGAGVVAATAGLAYLAYEAYESEKAITGIAEGFALTGRGAKESRAAVAAEIDQLKELPGVTTAIARAVVEWEAANGQISDQINVAVNQLLPQYVTWFGAKAPEAVAKLKTQLQSIASESAPQASAAFEKMNTSALHMTTAQAAVIEGMIASGERTKAWIAVLEDLARKGGGRVDDIKTKIAETKRDLDEAKQSADAFAVAMQMGAAAGGDWSAAEQKVANFEARLKQLQGDFASLSAAPVKLPLSDLDRYTAGLARNASLVRDTPQQRAIDTALIDAATAKLRDQGQAEMQVVTSAKQARDILGSQASAIANTALSGYNPDKSGEKARTTADEVANIQTATMQKRIASEAMANAALLAMGQETDAQFAAQATKLENDRYAIVKQGLAKRMAADSGDKFALAKDYAEEEQAELEHQDKLADIRTQATEKQQQTAQRAANDYVQDQNRQLQAGLSNYAISDTAHSASIAARESAELGMVSSVQANVDRVLQVQIDSYAIGTQQYNEAVKAKIAADDEYAQRHNEIVRQAADEELATQRAVISEIDNAESQLVSDIFTKRQSLSADLAQIGYKELQTEIADDLKAETEYLITHNAEKAVAQEGIIGQAIGMIPTTAAPAAQVTNQAAQMANTAAITALTTALTGHGAIVATGTAATAATAAASTINTASTTGNTVATAANTDGLIEEAAKQVWSGITSLVGLLGFASGADNIPNDMVAQIHKGEMIVPAGPAAAIRAGGGLNMSGIRGGDTTNNSGGDTHHHWNMDTKINGNMDKGSFTRLLNDSHEELAMAIMGMMRSGSLRM